MEGILSAWGRILTGHTPVLSIEITRECPLRCPGCYAYGDDHIGGGVTLRGAAEVTLIGCTLEGPGLTLDGGRDIQIVHSVIDAIGTGLTLTGGVSGVVTTARLISVSADTKASTLRSQSTGMSSATPPTWT